MTVVTEFVGPTCLCQMDGIAYSCSSSAPGSAVRSAAIRFRRMLSCCSFSPSRIFPLQVMKYWARFITMPIFRSRTLSSVGASLDDLVQLNFYIKNVSDFRKGADVFREYFKRTGPAPLPPDPPQPAKGQKS